MEIVKIAAVCLVAAVLAKVIQPTNRDLAAVLSLSAVIFGAFIALNSIYEVITGIRGILSGAGIAESYITLAFKALGICFISELCSQSCRDCGETALGSVIDIAGRTAVALLCVPLLREFIGVVRSVLEK